MTTVPSQPSGTNGGGEAAAAANCCCTPGKQANGAKDDSKGKNESGKTSGVAEAPATSPSSTSSYLPQGARFPPGAR